MEEREIMAFKTEDGEKVEFEKLGEIYLNEDTKDEKGYILLAPLEESDDMFALRINETEAGIEYLAVEDDKEFLEIKKAYKKLIY